MQAVPQAQGMGVAPFVCKWERARESMNKYYRRDERQRGKCPRDFVIPSHRRRLRGRRRNGGREQGGLQPHQSFAERFGIRGRAEGALDHAHASVEIIDH